MLSIEREERYVRVAGIYLLVEHDGIVKFREYDEESEVRRRRIALLQILNRFPNKFIQPIDSLNFFGVELFQSLFYLIHFG